MHTFAYVNHDCQSELSCRFHWNRDRSPSPPRLQGRPRPAIARRPQEAGHGAGLRHRYSSVRPRRACQAHTLLEDLVLKHENIDAVSAHRQTQRPASPQALDFMGCQEVNLEPLFKNEWRAWKHSSSVGRTRPRYSSRSRIIRSRALDSQCRASTSSGISSSSDSTARIGSRICAGTSPSRCCRPTTARQARSKFIFPLATDTATAAASLTAD